jgi:hypothetical protein
MFFKQFYFESLGHASYFVVSGGHRRGPGVGIAGSPK